TQPRPAARDCRRDAPLLQPHLDVGPWRVLDGLQLAAAGLAGGHLRTAMGADPLGPVRPPGTGMLLGGGQPGLRVRGILVVGPVAVLVGRRRAYDAGHVAGRPPPE